MQAPQPHMPNHVFRKATMVFAAVLVAICCLLLTACAQPQAASDEEKPVTAGEYMTSVAKSSKQLSASLQEFAAAVSDNDVSAVQAKADAAYDALAQLEALEAPDELNEVKGKYDEASQSLKDAMKDYVALYLEIENAPEGSPYDFSNYAAQIESIQKAYDNGLNLLEEADKMASEM